MKGGISKILLDPSSGNPHKSALDAGNAAAASHADAIRKLTGGRKKRKGGATVAPQFTMLYNSPSPTNPNSIIASSATNQLQAAENAKYDSHASTGGGRKRRKTKKRTKRTKHRRTTRKRRYTF